MKLISHIADLKAVSGGYFYDEFVTADTIFYQSVFSAMGNGMLGGLLVYAGCIYLNMAIEEAVALGSLGVVAAGYLGYNYNQYSDIEPNTWVRWDITIVYV